MGICPFKTLFSKDLRHPVWVRCGQCLECRKMNLSGKVLQMRLEKTGSMHSQFVTLTFDPIHEANPEFNIKDPSYWQKFLKRLRKNYPSIDGSSIRYFRVGEHGDKNGRWHYHFIFFHLPKNLDQEEWAKLWRMGFAHTLEVNEKTITYIAKYTATNKYKEEHENYNPHQYTEHSCSNGMGQEAVKILAQKLYAAGHTLVPPKTQEDQSNKTIPERPHTIKLDGDIYTPTRTIMNKFVEEFERLQGYKLPDMRLRNYITALENRRIELGQLDTIRKNYQYKVTKHKLETQNGVWKAETTPQSEKIASNPYLSQEDQSNKTIPERPHTIKLDGDIYTPTRTIMNKFVEEFERLQGYKLPDMRLRNYITALENRRIELGQLDTIRKNYQYKVTKHKLETQNGVWKAETTPQSEKIASNPYLSQEDKNKIHSTTSFQDVWTTTADPPRIYHSSTKIGKKSKCKFTCKFAYSKSA